MTWAAAAGGVAAILTIIGLGLAAFRWLIRIELRNQFEPNGGQSFRDHVDRRLDAQDVRLGRIEQRVSRLEVLRRWPGRGA